MEEKKKEKMNRKDYWLHKRIVVKLITKKLGERYHKKKAVVLVNILLESFYKYYTLFVLPLKSLKIFPLNMCTLKTCSGCMDSTPSLRPGLFLALPLLEFVSYKGFIYVGLTSKT